MRAGYDVAPLTINDACGNKFMVRWALVWRLPPVHTYIPLPHGDCSVTPISSKKRA